MTKLFELFFVPVDSQTLRFGEDDSFEEGDYSDGNSTDSNLIEQRNEDESNGHLNYSQASRVIAALQQHQISSQIGEANAQQQQDEEQQQQEDEDQQQQQQQNSAQINGNNSQQLNDSSNIPWDQYLCDAELRDMGLQRIVQDNDENGQQNSDIRLTAPPEEVRHRQKQSKRSNQADVTAQLRAKQMEIANVQLAVQKILLENAKIAKDEANERLATAKALRQCAELDLASKMTQQNTE